MDIKEVWKCHRTLTNWKSISFPCMICDCELNRGWFNQEKTSGPTLGCFPSKTAPCNRQFRNSHLFSGNLSGVCYKNTLYNPRGHHLHRRRCKWCPSEFFILVTLLLPTLLGFFLEGGARLVFVCFCFVFLMVGLFGGKEVWQCFNDSLSLAGPI